MNVFFWENWIIYPESEKRVNLPIVVKSVFLTNQHLFFTDLTTNKFANLQRVKNQRAARTEMEAEGEIPKTVTSKEKRGTYKQKTPQKRKRNQREKRTKKENVQSRNDFRPLGILVRKLVRNACSSSFRK